MCSGNKVIKNIFSLFMCVLPSSLALYGEMEGGASHVLMEEKEPRKAVSGSTPHLLLTPDRPRLGLKVI